MQAAQTSLADIWQLKAVAKGVMQHLTPQELQALSATCSAVRASSAINELFVTMYWRQHASSSTPAPSSSSSGNNSGARCSQWQAPGSLFWPKHAPMPQALVIKAARGDSSSSSSSPGSPGRAAAQHAAAHGLHPQPYCKVDHRIP